MKKKEKPQTKERNKGKRKPSEVEMGWDKPE